MSLTAPTLTIIPFPRYSVCALCFPRVFFLSSRLSMIYYLICTTNLPNQSLSFAWSSSLVEVLCHLKPHSYEVGLEYWNAVDVDVRRIALIVERRYHEVASPGM